MGSGQLKIGSFVNDVRPPGNICLVISTQPAGTGENSDSHNTRDCTRLYAG